MGDHRLYSTERIEMSRLYEAGTSRREIGRIIGRSASTVGRELRRNTLPRGGYKPASGDCQDFRVKAVLITPR